MASSDLTLTGISDLPENVLLHIISFLPIKDAISTSFLSKAWRNLWTCSPSLDFEIVSRVEIFTPFVEQALRRRHHANLRSLSITCYYHEGGGHHVDNWLRIAAQNNIQKLKLDFIAFDWDGDFPDADLVYSLSLSALSSSASLTTLNLCRCRLVSSVRAVFRSLRTLSLEQVDFTDDIFLDLIAGCPELDSLILERCAGIRHLKISSSRLKNLSLCHYDHEDSSVEIDAPNLIFFNCFDYVADDYSLKDVSSLVHASVIFNHWDWNLDEISCFDPRCKIVEGEGLNPVKRLAIGSWWSEYLLWKIQHHQKILPYHVEYLELSTGFSKVKFLGLAVILNHSPNLRTAIIYEEFERDDEGFESEVLENYLHGSLPQLKIFKIYSCGSNEKETELEIELVKLLLKRGTSLEEMILVGGPRSNLLKDHSDELQNFPRSSEAAKISIVD